MIKLYYDAAFMTQKEAKAYKKGLEDLNCIAEIRTEKTRCPSLFPYKVWSNYKTVIK